METARMDGWMDATADPGPNRTVSNGGHEAVSPGRKVRRGNDRETMGKATSTDRPIRGPFHSAARRPPDHPGHALHSTAQHTAARVA